MRKWVIRLAVFLAIAVLFVVLKFTVFASDPVEVKVVEVGRGRVESTVTNSRAGTVRARRRANLSPETSGRVVDLPHREGEVVEAGQLLVQLDDSLQAAQLELARRNLDTVEAQHQEACVLAKRAERELERNRKLADRKVISADLLDELESAHEAAIASCATAAARLARAGAEISLSETDLERTQIRSPFKGVLAEVGLELGEWLTPSPPGVPLPAVIDLIDPTSNYISAPMDEVDLAVIRAGLRVRVTLDPHPGRSFSGKVLRVAPYVLDVEEQNRTVEIEVELDDKEFSSTLLPGTSADVEVILSLKEDVLRIPSSTLLEGGRVLVLENGELVDRRVETGLKNWDWVEVLGGVAEGESVVSSLGSTLVRAGSKAVVKAEDSEQ